MAKPPQKILVRPYMDALNFYHRIAKKYQFKWIDIKSLLCALIQLHFDKANKGEFQVEIEKIYLFTAEVRGDADAWSRQHAYLGALQEKYGDSLVLVKGDMTEVRKKGKPVSEEIKKIAESKKGLVVIETYEEKQTDVNIACQMVHDAHTAAGKEFDVACLVSNDSDLIPPLRIKQLLKQRTLWICSKTKDKELPKKFRDFVSEEDCIHYISWGMLKKHRLPDPVGKWKCPDLWKEQEEKHHLKP